MQPLGISRLAELERVFPSVVQHIVLNLMLPCLMLSQHAAAEDKQSYEIGQASLLKVFSQLKSEETEGFSLKCITKHWLILPHNKPHFAKTKM